MSYIHFKTKMNPQYERIIFDGVSLTLPQLKKLLIEKLKFSRKNDIDIQVSNVDTNEIYKDEDSIPKNSRVEVRRVPKLPAPPIRSQAKPVPVAQAAPTPQPQTVAPTPAPITRPPPVPQPKISQKELEHLMPLNYAAPKPHPMTTTVKTGEIKASDITHDGDSGGKNQDEKEKLATLMTEMSEFAKGPADHQTSRYHKSFGGKTMPRPYYTCPICKKTGHSRTQCPDYVPGTTVREEKVKYPSGIPRDNLIKASAGDPGAMLGTDGYVVPKLDSEAYKTVKKDKMPFMSETEEEEQRRKKLEETRAERTPPLELTCYFNAEGRHLMRDAVLLSCCGKLVCCDECIRNRLCEEDIFQCPECGDEIKSIDSVTPNLDMRKKISEYQNDVKMNKLIGVKGEDGGSASKSSSDDAFLDLLLNEPQAPVSKAAISPSYDAMAKSSGEITSESDSGEAATKMPVPKSPVQDSKISTTKTDGLVVGEPIVEPPTSIPQQPVVPQQPIPTTSESTIKTLPVIISSGEHRTMGGSGGQGQGHVPTRMPMRSGMYPMDGFGGHHVPPGYGYRPPYQNFMGQMQQKPMRRMPMAPVRPPMIPPHHMKFGADGTGGVPMPHHHHPGMYGPMQGQGHGGMMMGPYGVPVHGYPHQAHHGMAPHASMQPAPPQVRMSAAAPPMAPMHGIMSESEFYQYQEKLKKEKEMFGATRRSVSRSCSRSRSRSRGSRSRSRSYRSSESMYKRGDYRRNGRRSRSRGRGKRSRSRSYRRRGSYSRSRSSSYHRRSRSRTYSPKRETVNGYSGGGSHDAEGFYGKKRRSRSRSRERRDRDRDRYDDRRYESKYKSGRDYERRERETVSKSRALADEKDRGKYVDLKRGDLKKIDESGKETPPKQQVVVPDVGVEKVEKSEKIEKEKKKESSVSRSLKDKDGGEKKESSKSKDSSSKKEKDREKEVKKEKVKSDEKKVEVDKRRGESSKYSDDEEPLKKQRKESKEKEVSESRDGSRERDSKSSKSKHKKSKKKHKHKHRRSSSRS